MFRKTFILMILFFEIFVFGETNKFHFYNLKKVVALEGKILDFKSEKVYRRRSDFFFIYLEDKNGEKVKVEVCPKWFFNEDLAKGMKIKVKGSDLGKEDEYRYLIAKEIEFGGDKVILRDKFGFPLWRGKNPNRLSFGERRRRGRGGKK